MKKESWSNVLAYTVYFTLSTDYIKNQIEESHFQVPVNELNILNSNRLFGWGLAWSILYSLTLEPFIFTLELGFKKYA